MADYKHPYFYRPDEMFDFGDLLGEHPVEFTCWIGETTPGYQLPVSILRVVILPQIDDPKNQVWDITALIKRYPGRMARYEDEIRDHILARREREWDEETA